MSVASLTPDKKTDRIRRFSHIDALGNIKIGIPDKSQSKNVGKNWQNLGLYINIGYYLLIPILVCLAMGIFLDNKFNTKHTFTVWLIIIGSILSIYNLWTLVVKEHASHQH